VRSVFISIEAASIGTLIVYVVRNIMEEMCDNNGFLVCREKFVCLSKSILGLESKELEFNTLALGHVRAFFKRPNIGVGSVVLITVDRKEKRKRISERGILIGDFCIHK
jgi:hypothetical protein